MAGTRGRRRRAGPSPQRRGWGAAMGRGAGEGGVRGGGTAQRARKLIETYRRNVWGLQACHDGIGCGGGAVASEVATWGHSSGPWGPEIIVIPQVTGRLRRRRAAVRPQGCGRRRLGGRRGHRYGRRRVVKPRPMRGRTRVRRAWGRGWGCASASEHSHPPSGECGAPDNTRCWGLGTSEGIIDLAKDGAHGSAMGPAETTRSPTAARRGGGVVSGACTPRCATPVMS